MASVAKAYPVVEDVYFGPGIFLARRIERGLEFYIPDSNWPAIRWMGRKLYPFGGLYDRA